MGGAADITCDKCRCKYCPKCKNEWTNARGESHQGLSCEHWTRTMSKTDAQFRQEQKDEQIARKDTQKCPKCSEPISKNNGCNHMTCRCKHEFCWECLGPAKNELLTNRAQKWLLVQLVRDLPETH